MKKILIVEDSTTVTKILKHIIKQDAGITGIFAETFDEGRALYDQHGEELFAAIVDLHLPDAPTGETVDYFLGKNLPVIVLTANYQEEKRDELLKKGIVDYILKESRYSYNYALKLINRLDKNQRIKVLVAEDSKPARKLIKQLLERHLYQVLEAENGLEALDILKENVDTKMLITDYHMPEMDGFDLVRAIRQNVDQTDLSIIGLSGDGHGTLSAKFIKNGANDFLAKPFNHEEFHCRIMHNIEEQEHIEEIREAANRDFLTGVYNRRYFFEKGNALFQQAQHNNTPLSLAMLSIDHFKDLTDNYGIESGDKVLQFLAYELQHGLSRFIIARHDGEKFCILLPGLKNDQACALLDKLRGMIATMSIDLENSDDDVVHISISGGISSTVDTDFDSQMRTADELLRNAKDAGRNLIVGD